MKAWICEDLETGDASIVEAEAWDEARAAYVLGVTGANARALAPQQREPGGPLHGALVTEPAYPRD